MELSLSPLSGPPPPNILRWAWALVIACGLLLGYYVLQTYGTPLYRQYQLDFGQAQWIEPQESYAPTAYFRKEVYLPSIPEQAWLEIAASDNFALVVNGRTLDTLSSVKTFVTGIYDLKSALKQGTNVINLKDLLSGHSTTAPPRPNHRTRKRRHPNSLRPQLASE